MASVASDSAPRKRLLSVTGDGNTTRARQTENTEAFQRVLELYVDAKYETDPIRSCLVGLDINSDYRRWTFDNVILTADVERSISRALHDDAALIEKLHEWFIWPRILPGWDEPSKLTPDEKSIYGKIVQRCGSMFRSRKLYPLHKYFHCPAKIQAVLEAA